MLTKTRTFEVGVCDDDGAMAQKAAVKLWKELDRVSRGLFCQYFHMADAGEGSRSPEARPCLFYFHLRCCITVCDASLGPSGSSSCAVSYHELHKIRKTSQADPSMHQWEATLLLHLSCAVDQM